jgi:anthranilate/para-aminobenzoate synthase component II
MKGMGEGGEDCPFEFNFDEASFKVGDTVSYRVSTMEGFPFVGTLLEVHADYVVISPGPMEPDARYKGTRESRPLVDGSEI